MKSCSDILKGLGDNDRIWLQWAASGSSLPLCQGGKRLQGESCRGPCSRHVPACRTAFPAWRGKLCDWLWQKIFVTYRDLSFLQGVSKRKQLHVNMELCFIQPVFSEDEALLSPLKESRLKWISSYRQAFQKHRVRAHGHLFWSRPGKWARFQVLVLKEIL